MFSFLTKIFGTANDRIIKGLQKEVLKINALEKDLLSLTDEELKAKTSQLPPSCDNNKLLSLQQSIHSHIHVRYAKLSEMVLELRQCLE